MTTTPQTRDEAMAAADAGADDYWKECIDASVKKICKDLGFGGTFTTDLVWEYVERDFPKAKTHETRALGPAMARAGRARLIHKTGQYEESARPECHQRPVAVWKISTFSV